MLPVRRTNIMQLRSDFKDAFLEKHGVKLGFMSGFVKVRLSEGVKTHPSYYSNHCFSSGRKKGAFDLRRTVRKPNSRYSGDRVHISQTFRSSAQLVGRALLVRSLSTEFDRHRPPQTTQFDATQDFTLAWAFTHSELCPAHLTCFCGIP
jgi:hypothetical protein